MKNEESIEDKIICPETLQNIHSVTTFVVRTPDYFLYIFQLIKSSISANILSMNNKKSNLINVIVVIATIIIAFTLGIIFDDYIWGSLTLIFGFLNTHIWQQLANGRIIFLDSYLL